MLDLLVRNAGGNLSERDRDYAAKKLGRLGRYFPHVDRVEIVHSEQKQDHRIQVTVFADGLTVRGEEVDGSTKAAIDRVSDKLEVRLGRLKSRLSRAFRRGVKPIPETYVEPEALEPETPEPPVVVTKKFSTRPMTMEEAILQMELLEHPFFVFHSGESGRTEVIYRRKDGALGRLIPG